MQKSEHKLELIKRINELEKKELWHLDVEDDPETYPLMADKVDYLNEKLSSKIKNKIANIAGTKFFDKMIAKRQLIIKEIRGIENFTAVNGGRIVTCNHFSVCDNYAVWIALREHMSGKMLYKVIREGNYTNPPKPFGLFMRHCNTLPLSSQKATMKKFFRAVKTLFERGETILIYPEQSMWWNYRKPKPLQRGAYRFAVKNNVPILPVFITMKDSTVRGEDGFFVQEYTIHISPPVYPEGGLGYHDNVTRLMGENERVWREIYERTYGMPLAYETAPEATEGSRA
jgi:1-acyl-sn-glycerol-3-phosphate acyltransferase